MGENGLVLRTTDVGISWIDDNSIEYPTEFKLDQNYPNPFNPTTTINYQLAEGGKVILKVYDILGKEVATLVDEYKLAGIYEVSFNSHSGLSLWVEARNLTSGVYFYQLKAGEFVETKKMIFLK